MTETPDVSPEPVPEGEPLEPREVPDKEAENLVQPGTIEREDVERDKPDEPAE